MKYIYWERFEKEFKRLCKKYKSLWEDFEDFLSELISDPTWKNILVNNIERITIKDWSTYYKVRKFVCRSISRSSSNSWIRIVYKYFDDKTIEFEEITFIEIYHKNDRENHDSSRFDS